MVSLPADKTDFIGLEAKVHLATGGEPPLLRAHRKSFELFAAHKAEGMDGYRSHWAIVDTVREKLASMIGLDSGDIALVGNASEAIARVISSIAWQAGDNVVVSELDYASGRFGLANLRNLGVELRLVAADRWTIDETAIVAACDARTRLVYISQVNALTGQHLNVKTLGDALEGSPTALLNDASHALGVVPVAGQYCDFVASCCYKFVLGIHEGILAWNQHRRPDFTPSGVGWHAAESGAAPDTFERKPDAQRAEYGNAGHLGAYLLDTSLDYLASYGIDAIASHARSLSQRLVDGFTSMDLDILSPTNPEQRAGNAAFHCRDPETIVRQAAADGILVWGDNNRIRASAHLFTTQSDVDLFLERLPSYLQSA